jgi:hypothetical protein
MSLVIYSEIASSQVNTNVYGKQTLASSELQYVGIHVCRNGFTILSLVQEQSVVVLYWRGLKSLGFDMDEHGEHQDLRGSRHRSIIPYVYGRMRVVLLKHYFFLSCLV